VARTLFVLQAIVNVLFAIPLIFATSTLLSMYGISTDRTGTYIAQFLGGVFLILAWNSWFARDWPDNEVRRMLIRGAFIGTAVAFVASVMFQLSSASTTSTWLFVILTGIFTVGWGYYSYASMQPVTRQQTA
jgi:hypothetical protein